MLLCLYALLWYRIVRSRLKQDDTTTDAALYATFCVITKFAQLVGLVRYLSTSPTRNSSTTIECTTARQRLA